MKKVNLSIQEFDNFKFLARKYAIKFFCEIVHGTVVIEADSAALESLGY